MLSPVIDDAPCFCQTSKPMLIEAVVSEFAVEAFYKGILGWFSRLNEVQFNAGLSAPEEHRFIGHLSAIITNDCAG